MSEELKAYLERHFVRQAEVTRSLKDYLRDWDIHRLRLLDNLDAPRRCRQPVGDPITSGDIVRVYRPATKRAMSWSSRLYKVMEIRAQIARVRPECAQLGESDEVQYVFNLAKVTDIDGDAVDDRFVDPQPAHSAHRAARRAARRAAKRDAMGGGEC
ncbi:hypothetical protein Pmar_PMAR002620 [Perkinsus marinus ATCC 50983]|uniref:Uncharacterized protein n=1 Tax=Perkinsus marinus (strain ATCC 50983 / TXsc) TaxID=423536 RepID=C5LNS5_PERM5|nr:hypothetical protein Pmar_PMAR002620 [Perkinsus marinus ATCC 50983]EER01626.1 hypothetical protein Pmar_PMAR002620 [Perkinsus marinus ATCC 50983]|eukprot:XP_002768908.1 hypothetical protein Pmar_PMAR002620 [Perkinsus marinus ATCC 50983]